MILAAALLVLVALGLFVAGLLSGVTVWYWACVAVSALAAVLLVVARRQMGRADAEADAAAREPVPTKAASSSSGASAAAVVEKPAAPVVEKPAAPEPEPEPEPAPPPPAAPPVPEREQARAATADSADGGDPPPEDVEVTDLLLVVDMHDDVFVVDEHPRYHLADCRWLAGREAIPFPVDEARTDGFTPCGICSPDRHLAGVARARKAGAS